MEEGKVLTYHVRRLPDGSIRATRPYNPNTPEEKLLRSIFGPITITGPLRDPEYCWDCGAGPNVYCIHDPEASPR